MSDHRIRCISCNTSLCQLEETEDWYCPTCRKWYTLSRHIHRYKTKRQRHKEQAIMYTYVPSFSFFFSIFYSYLIQIIPYTTFTLHVLLHFGINPLLRSPLQLTPASLRTHRSSCFTLSGVRSTGHSTTRQPPERRIGFHYGKNSPLPPRFARPPPLFLPSLVSEV